jgi:hypothetical protein
MSGIVTEQWIQVQHLEQALHIAKVSKAYSLLYNFFVKVNKFKFVFLSMSFIFLLCKDEGSKGSMASELKKMHILEGNLIVQCKNIYICHES